MRGAHVGAGELVGLIPARCCVFEAASAAGVTSPADASGLPTVTARVLPPRGAFHLERLDDDRVLEWHLRA